MAVTIYGIAFSRTFRVLWAANELGLEYDHVPTHFVKESKQPEFLAINPNGRVPALADDGLVLFESMAINLYLARKYGAPLRPASPEDEALAVQWSFWVVKELEDKLLEAMIAALGLFGKEADREGAQAILGQVARPLGILNTRLEGREWLVGDGYSVADCNVAGVMHFARTARLDLSAHPAVSGWLDRCYARPAAKATQAMARAAAGG